MSELTTFASRLTMPNGVMVAHQILVLFVWVRVLFGQHKSKHEVWNFFLLFSTGISPSTTAATEAAARSLSRCRRARRIGFRAALAAGNPAPQSYP